MNKITFFTKSTKLISIGNSTGVLLPKELLDRVRLNAGDKVVITESPDGFTIRSFDPEFEKQMDAAEAVMRQDRDILRKLAE